MSNVESWKAGVLRELWNDTTRQYSAWNAQGVPVVGTPRAYTVQENLDADIRIAADIAPNNQKTLTDGLLASLAALKANIDLMNAVIAQTNATINSNPASAIKDCARANKDATRACIRLIKIELEQFQDADTGAA